MSLWLRFFSGPPDRSTCILYDRVQAGPGASCTGLLTYGVCPGHLLHLRVSSLSNIRVSWFVRWPPLCLVHSTSTELQRGDPVKRRTRSLVTCVSVTAWLAAAELGRLVLSQFVRCEHTLNRRCGVCLFSHHHYHHHFRVASEGRRVVAPPCPRSTARLQSSPIGRVESFRSWSSHLFRGRPGGRRHVRSGARLSDTLMWSLRAMFAGVMSSQNRWIGNCK